jgi:hypothetical protein
MGSSDIEAAHIDMISEHCVDVRKAYGDCRFGLKDEALAAAKLDFMTNKLKEFAVKIESCLAQIPSENGFAVGTKLSYADIRLYDLFMDFFDDKEACQAAIDNSGGSKLKSSIEAARVAMATWLETRPQTAF